jgi:hypothetical protein
MERTTYIPIFMMLPALLFSLISLHADVDESFVKRNSMVNKSFIKSVAKDRATMGSSSAQYVEINGKEELKDALASGELDNTLEEGNGIDKQYIYREINNVKLTDRDLRDVEGDTLNLGAEVDGDGQKVVQVLNIKNTTIETDRHINAGIVSDSDNIDGLTNVTNIQNSVLSGGR